eukprot:scaffold2.g7440.t1
MSQLQGARVPLWIRVLAAKLLVTLAAPADGGEGVSAAALEDSDLSLAQASALAASAAACHDMGIPARAAATAAAGAGVDPALAAAVLPLVPAPGQPGQGGLRKVRQAQPSLRHGARTGPEVNAAEGGGQAAGEEAVDAAGHVSVEDEQQATAGMEDEQQAQQATAGEAVYEAELAAILAHNRQQQQAAAQQQAAPPSGADARGGGQARQEPTRPSSQERAEHGEQATQAGRGYIMSDGSCALLFRTLASTAGMQPALALLFILDASPLPYPTRTPRMLYCLAHWAAVDAEPDAALLVLRQAKAWGLPGSRLLYVHVMNAAAKAGRVGLVRDVMGEMCALVGEAPDALCYTILLMAHEKAEDWRGAVGVYREMRQRGLQRSSFAYRQEAVKEAVAYDAAFEALQWMAREESGKWKEAVDGSRGSNHADSPSSVRKPSSGAEEQRGQQQQQSGGSVDLAGSWAAPYVALAAAALLHGDLQQAAAALARLRADGLWLNEVEASSLLRVCSNNGQELLAVEIFKQMRSLGLLDSAQLRRQRELQAQRRAEQRVRLQQRAEFEAQWGSAWVPAASGGSNLEDAAVADEQAALELLEQVDDERAESEEEGSDTEDEEVVEEEGEEEEEAGATGRTTRRAHTTRRRGKWQARRRLRRPVAPPRRGGLPVQQYTVPPEATAAAAEASADPAVRIYSRVLYVCQKAKLYAQAWELYRMMRADGLQPNTHGYTSLLVACAHSRRPDNAQALCAEMRGRGLPFLPYCCNQLLLAVAAAPDAGARWPAFLDALHHMHTELPAFRDTFVQTTAITMAGRTGRLGDAVAVYRLMLQDGVLPRLPTFNALMAACIRTGHDEMGFAVLEAMRQMGVAPDIISYSTFLASSDRQDMDWRRSEEVWGWMLEAGITPDTVSLNNMLICYDKAGLHDRVLELFDQASLQLLRFCPVMAGRAGLSIPAAVQAREWVEHQKGEGAAHRITYVQLLDYTFGLDGPAGWRRVVDVFEGHESELGLSVCTPAISSYYIATLSAAKLGRWERVAQLIDLLRARGTPPNSHLFNGLIAIAAAAAAGAAAASGSESEGNEDEDGGELMEERDGGDGSTGGPASGPADAPRPAAPAETAATGAAAVEGAEPPPSVQSLLDMMEEAGDADGGMARARALLQEMRERGLMPTISSLNSLLVMCMRIADAESALGYWNTAVRDWRITPDDITYSVLLDCLAKAGRGGEALVVLITEAMDKGVGVRAFGSWDPASPDAAKIDLHFMSVPSASLVLRAWLLWHKGQVARGRRAPRDREFTIITGWGRNSSNNVARLRPEVARLLEGGSLGAPLALETPPNNAGVFVVPSDRMYAWLLDGAELGLSVEEEGRMLHQLELRQEQLVADHGSSK